MWLFAHRIFHLEVFIYLLKSDFQKSHINLRNIYL